MKLLAIDTSTEACSAALLIEDEISCRYRMAPKQHAALILSMIDELLLESDTRLTDLDALAFGRGPGAFTGVRIAAGVTQGLAFGADLPVIPVSTLAALAQGADTKSTDIISSIDARMGEIYWGLFRKDQAGLVIATSEEAVSKPEAITVTDAGGYYGVGTAWLNYRQSLEGCLGAQLSGFDGNRYPHARDIVLLAQREYLHGRTVDPEQAVPVYLRNMVTG